jgi:hypothetical protein
VVIIMFDTSERHTCTEQLDGHTRTDTHARTLAHSSIVPCSFLFL